MRVLYVTSEVFPFAKTGGLADVSASLPSALKEYGVDVRVLVPGYRQAIARAANATLVHQADDPLGNGQFRVLETYLPNSDVPVWLVDAPQYYGREGGLYQSQFGEDWPDNALRFALLNHVAAVIAKEPAHRWRPDLIHCNDWHAGLLPLLLASGGRPRPATLFTVHNLAYQGLFSADELGKLALPSAAFGIMEFYGRISFLKAGIQAADALTTVSPTYAREIRTPEYGCGLDGLLRERSSQLTGILNGVDYQIWDPASDQYLPCNYSARAIAPKADCKRSIQSELGLEPQPGMPLLAFLSRLVHQKMPDVVLDVLPAFVEQGAQFVSVAEGDNGYQAAFRELAARYPGQVAVEGYQECLAHRVLAGADMVLHPSRFEPCGLVPIYGMRYGTAPLVRNSGGMADTVIDATPEAIRQGTATGFSFEEPSATALANCIARAIALYRQPIAWRRLQASGMRQDFSWRRSAKTYADLYHKLTGAPALKARSKPAKAEAALSKLTA
jgi:starch synthase